jgi:hypothetical protein
MIDRRKEKKAKREADKIEQKRRLAARRKEKDDAKRAAQQKAGSTRSFMVRFGRGSFDTETAHSTINGPVDSIEPVQEFGEYAPAATRVSIVTASDGSWERISVAEADGEITRWGSQTTGSQKTGGEGSMRRLVRRLHIA